MDGNSHFFLGLAGKADAFASILMSLLMAASNFLIGTFLISFFRPFSITESHSLSTSHAKMELLITTSDSGVPLFVAKKPRLHFTVRVTASRTYMRDSSFIIGAVKYNSRSTLASYFNDFHLFGVKNQFIFTHGVLL